MLSHLVIAVTAFIVSGLTLFSGFGLGTVLMPAFALFFPLTVAIPATAVVHLANNLFKVGLIGRKANMDVVLRFALPAALAEIAGASLLGLMAERPPVASYELLGQERELHLVKMVIGLVIVGFALLELSPRFEAPFQSDGNPRFHTKVEHANVDARRFVNTSQRRRDLAANLVGHNLLAFSFSQICQTM